MLRRAASSPLPIWCAPRPFQAYAPQFLIVVPRLLESVHKSIKDKFALQPARKQKLVAVLSAICVLYHGCLRRAKVRTATQ